MQVAAAAGAGSGAVAVAAAAAAATAAAAAAAAWHYASTDPQMLQPRIFSNAKSKNHGKHTLIATVSSLLPTICL